MKDKIEDALEEEHGYNDQDKDDTSHGLRANLKVNKRDGDEGVLKETRNVKNIIVNEGADMVRNVVGGAGGDSTQSVFAMRWTGIGNSAHNYGSTDTQLGSEVARSHNAFNTTANYGQFSNVTTFTNVAATVRESGLFNDGAANSGTMLAAQSFGDITLTTSDSLEVIWKVYFSEV